MVSTCFGKPLIKHSIHASPSVACEVVHRLAYIGPFCWWAFPSCIPVHPLKSHGKTNCRLDEVNSATPLQDHRKDQANWRLSWWLPNPPHADTSFPAHRSASSTLVVHACTCNACIPCILECWTLRITILGMGCELKTTTKHALKSILKSLWQLASDFIFFYHAVSGVHLGCACSSRRYFGNRASQKFQWWKRGLWHRWLQTAMSQLRSLGQRHPLTAWPFVVPSAGAWAGLQTVEGCWHACLPCA